MSSVKQYQAFRLVDHSEHFQAKLWEVVFDYPGERFNKFDQLVMNDFAPLMDEMTELHQGGKLDAVIMTSAKNNIFIAGADIKMIQAARTAKDAEELSRKGQVLIDKWEDLPFPTVLAINGACMGGGCELSLASRAVLMSDHASAKIGLPEVLIGIFPGMGGSVRLPAKIGLAGAFDLMLTGKSLDSKRAHRAGLIEAALPKENFIATCLEWTQKNLAKLKRRERIAKVPKLGGMGGVAGSMLEKTPMGRSVIFSQAKKGVLAKTHGHYPAPLECIETVKAVGTVYGKRWSANPTARDRAMKREAEGFGRCAATDVSRHLINLFFLTEEVKKSNGLEGDAASQVEEQKPEHCAVLGAGVMGGGIAQLFAAKGFPIQMKDLAIAGLEAGIQAAQKVFLSRVKRRRMTKREMLQAVNLISPTVDYRGFKNVDYVVEAIIEDMELKKKVLTELEGEISEKTVVVSNTSSLSISEMQRALARPERFAGMHFFNPVHKMPLVEVIRGEKTSDQTVSTVYQLCKSLGKTPVVVKDGPGFLVNRILVPYLNEATYLFLDGVPMEEIDQAMVDFGMPMGPIELVDEVGVDVGHKVLKVLNDAFGERMPPAPSVGTLLDKKRLGKKASLGFYRYNKGKKELDSSVYGLLGITPKPGVISKNEIVERCVLPMINEAARCLVDGVVSSAAQLDLGMIMGTGFPPFRGGLMKYADTLGAARVVERLKHYHPKFGARFEPCDYLTEISVNNSKFYAQ